MGSYIVRTVSIPAIAIYFNCDQLAYLSEPALNFLWDTISSDILIAHSMSLVLSLTIAAKSATFFALASLAAASAAFCFSHALASSSSAVISCLDAALAIASANFLASFFFSLLVLTRSASSVAATSFSETAIFLALAAISAWTLRSSAVGSAH